MDFPNVSHIIEKGHLLVAFLYKLRGANRWAPLFNDW